MSPSIVVMGSINIDHVLGMPRFPVPGETIIATDYKVVLGGKGANQAVAAARFGADVKMIAAVGCDTEAKRIKQLLSQDGIEVTSIVEVDEQTGCAMVYVNAEGQNQIVIYPGANHQVTPNIIEQNSMHIAKADALLVQLETPVASVECALKIAQQHKVMTVLNPAPAHSLTDQMLAMVDCLTPNETEAEALTGIKIGTSSDALKAANVLHDKGIKNVLITLGEKGAWVSENGKSALIEGFKVQSIDTTAAGDTFNGVFLTALLSGEALQQAVRFAHAAAAITVTRHGAHPAIPWRSEVSQFLQNL